MERDEQKKQVKWKEMKQFVFRAMTAIRVVHIIYVLTSFISLTIV